jgi:hypothetical protein
MINVQTMSSRFNHLHCAEVLSICHEAEVLFSKGGIFLPEASGSVTRTALEVIKKTGVVTYYVGHGGNMKAVPASIPMPSGSAQEFDEPVQKACQSIYSAFRSFLDVNYPLHELVNAFACFDLEASLTWPQRQKLFNALAVHERLPAEESWSRSCILGCNAVVTFICANTAYKI